jgi:NitT/TauT family transport system substrate-binding protein
MARAFMRAYRRARHWVNHTPAAEIAAAEADFFPDAGTQALANAIAAYQKLGCWNPDPVIPRPAYEVALDVFAHSGRSGARHAYDDVVVPPPADA